MPIIYDIETISTGEFDPSTNQILMLDVSDTTMSSSGSNRFANLLTFTGTQELGVETNPVNFSFDAEININNFTGGTLQVFKRDGSLFPFTSSAGTSKNVVTPFFTELEASRIHSGFVQGEALDKTNRSSGSGLSFVRFSGDDFVFERAINPFHYKSGAYNLQFSNLSSLQAHLIDSLYETGEARGADVLTYDLAEESANTKINGFFKAGGFIFDSRLNPFGQNFDINLSFPKRFSAITSGDRGHAANLFTAPVFSNYTSTGRAGDYYNYLVNTLSSGISQNNSFINSEIAKIIKPATFGSISALNGSYVSPFRVTSGLEYAGQSRDDYFIINQDYQFNSGTGVTSSKFVSGFVESFTPSTPTGVTGGNVADQHLKYIFHSEAFKTRIPKAIDFRTGSAEIQTSGTNQGFLLTSSVNENPFSEGFSFIDEFATPYVTTISLFDTDAVISQNDITLNGFSNESVNQNYFPNGFTNLQPRYVSEDGNLEIIYGVTGLQSPVISSITGSGIGSGLASKSGEYVVTISGIYSGASYDLSFNNIKTAIYNSSGMVTGIETDFQSLPISNNFTLTPLNSGNVISFKLLETGITGLNVSSASGSFSTGDINFIRDQRFTPDDLNSNISGLNWVIRSGTFGNRQDLFVYTGDVNTNNTPFPTGLSSGWLNITGNSEENPSIVPSGGNDNSFLRSKTVSGGFILFTYEGLVSGQTYYKEIPVVTTIPEDSNVYLTSGKSLLGGFDHKENYLANFQNGISFTAQSFTHSAPVPYQISGSGFVKTEIDNFLLREDGGRFVREFTPDFSGIALGVSGLTGVSGVPGIIGPTGVITGSGIISGIISGTITGEADIISGSGAGSGIISGLSGISGSLATGGVTGLFVHGDPFVFRSAEFNLFIPSGTVVL